MTNGVNPVVAKRDFICDSLWINCRKHNLYLYLRLEPTGSRSVLVQARKQIDASAHRMGKPLFLRIRRSQIGMLPN